MNRNAYDPEITKIKNRNAVAFRQTTAYIKAGYYTAPSGKRVELDMQPMIDGGRCYHKELPKTEAPKVEGGTKVMVEKGDCLKVAERLVREGYRPALLNFASGGHPGGGVETGGKSPGGDHLPSQHADAFHLQLRQVVFHQVWLRAPQRQ